MALLRTGFACFWAAIALGATSAFGQVMSNDILLLSQQMSRLQLAGRHGEAVPLAQRSVELAEAELGPDHPTVAIYLDNLGVLQHTTGQHTAAEPLLQRALAIREKVLGPDGVAVALSLDHLASLYHSTGRYQEARRLLGRALEIRRKHFGGSDVVVAGTLARLAAVAQAEGDHRAADGFYRHGITIQAQLGEMGRGRLITMLEGYAAFLRSANRVAEAADASARADLLRIDGK